MEFLFETPQAFRGFIKSPDVFLKDHVLSGGRTDHRMEDFAEAEEYGIETERSEWRSVKKHYEIITELETKDKAWGLLNRFKPGFERKEKSWHEFDNYYNDQKDSGHTAMIMQHHPKYKS